MSCGGVPHYSLAGRFVGRPGRALAVLLLGTWAHIGAASATEAVDCAGIKTGPLHVVLAPGSSTRRTVEMNEGDTLAFTFRADARATGTITLVAGDGSERPLLHGPHGTQVSYMAERSGAVGFRLAAKGGEGATFVTTCSPADSPGTMALESLDVDMSLPLSFGMNAAQHTGASAAAVPDTSSLPLQWLSSGQSGEETLSDTYGVNLTLQPGFTVGVLAQFDQAGNPLLGPAPLSEQPWLAGPTASVQLGDGLSLGARAAWGSADPIIGHAADRQTLDAHLTSQQDAGPWRFSSTIGFAHVEERLDTAAAGTAESGRVDIKPEMAYRLDMGHSMYVEPKLMVGAFWNLGDAAITGTGAEHEARHMAETGITFGAADGTTLQVGGGVQEGATPSDNVWSGRMRLSIPLE